MSANNVIQADITATVALFGAVNMLAGYAIAHGPGISTQHYTQAGGKKLDEAAQLLTEKREKSDEYLIPAEDRIPNHVRIEDLIEERIRLDEETQSYSASLKNWNASRAFYHDSTKIHKRAKALSGRHRNKIGRKDGEVELNNKAQAIPFQGYRLGDNNGGEHLPPPNGGYISPFGYGPQAPAQTGQRLPYNANEYPYQNSQSGDYREYSLPDHPYATARG